MRGAARWVTGAVVATLFASCASSGLPSPGDKPRSSSATDASAAGASTASPADASAAAATSPTAPPSADGRIAIDVNGAASPFDRRLLGSNMPAWVGPAKLADASFQQRIKDLGTTVVRMPGGSWSSSYDWLACENGEGCAWTFAARPSDYVGFLAATDLVGMWTVNFNSTAQSAAALVAFFNGAVTDQHVIGPDRSGTDWGTVGDWATLRASHGHIDAQPVKYWEIGNEVYGAKPDAGPQCASFGWEDVWTCDGAAYVSGDDEHDGYLEFAAAMRAVDPTILVGAVGIGGDQAEWSGFGEKVIAGTEGSLDFYVVHDYGFGDTPSDEDALKRPVEAWPRTLAGPLEELAKAESDGEVPIAITEYNMFLYADGDKTAMMSHAIDALYMADTIGQMAGNGAQIANQWNIINGPGSTGSDYGLLDPDSSEPMPQFYALALWSRFEDQFVPCSVGFDAATALDAFCGRDDSGALSVLAINKTGDPIDSSIDVPGAVSYQASADVAAAPALDSTTMVYNGSATGDSHLENFPGRDLGSTEAGVLRATFDPYSITLLRLTPLGSESESTTSNPSPP